MTTDGWTPEKVAKLARSLKQETFSKQDLWRASGTKDSGYFAIVEALEPSALFEHVSPNKWRLCKAKAA